MSRKTRVAALLVLAGIAATGRASAQWGDDTVRAVDVTAESRLASTLMSPFCPGYTIEQCPSPYADSLRMWMRARLADGATPAAIESTLIARYGEQIRGAPRFKGLGIMLWLLPVASLLVAAYVATRRLRRRAVAAARPHAPALTREQQERLDEALASFDG